jgi:hypothetical protein
MSHDYEQGPAELIAYFKSGVHTGRGPGLDEAVSTGFIRGLLAEEPIAQAARTGKICYTTRLTTGPLDRNVDLVVGPTSRSSHLEPPELGMIRAAPTEVWLALEVKSIMTEHGKAQRNRRTDLNAHALNIHAEYPTAVIAGLCVVNASDTYVSHTRGGQVNFHGDGKAKARSAFRELSNVLTRTDATKVGLDAVCVNVVVVTNANLASARFLGSPPAPADGDRMSYSSFTPRCASLLADRFL